VKEGWKKTTLGAAFATATGSTPPKNNDDFYGKFMPLVKPPELRDATLDSAEDGLSEAGADVARTVPPNSILVSCIGNLGKIGLNIVPVAFNQQINAILPNDCKAIPQFMFYQVLSTSFREQLEALASGTTVPIVNKSKFNSIEIVLAPLPEQHRIVAILDEAFDGIATAKANAEKNLQNARALFESHLQAVFSQRGEGWVEKPLNELCDIKHGFAFDGAEFSSDVPEGKPIVITPGNFTEDGKLLFNDKNTKRFSGNAPIAFRFNAGDLVVVMTDLSSKMKILGKPAFVDTDGVLHNQRIGRVIFFDATVEKRFVYYFMMSEGFLKNIKESATGTMVKHTAPTRILSNLLPFPHEREQQIEIISKLDNLREETQRLESIYQQKLAALDELKKSLLHQASIVFGSFFARCDG
jgi:type I restriction enzyme S subunit